MYSKPKTQQEKLWLQQVVEFSNETSWLGDIFHQHCSTYKHYEIHHIEGSQAKVKTALGTIKFGEFFILPIPFELHNIKSNHPLNVTSNKKKFEATFGTQKELFLRMINKMIDLGYEELPDQIQEAMRHV